MFVCAHTWRTTFESFGKSPTDISPRAKPSYKGINRAERFSDGKAFFRLTAD
jgi:hypothetical protein